MTYLSIQEAAELWNVSPRRVKQLCKSGESLDRLADDAIRQINEKRYETNMRAAGIREIRKIGMAFRGKEIKVKEQ